MNGTGTGSQRVRANDVLPSSLLQGTLESLHKTFCAMTHCLYNKFCAV